jgi:hypothetical protein
MSLCRASGFVSFLLGEAGAEMLHGLRAFCSVRPVEIGHFGRAGRDRWARRGQFSEKHPIFNVALEGPKTVAQGKGSLATAALGSQRTSIGSLSAAANT